MLVTVTESSRAHLRINPVVISQGPNGRIGILDEIDKSGKYYPERYRVRIRKHDIQVLEFELAFDTFPGWSKGPIDLLTQSIKQVRSHSGEKFFDGIYTADPSCSKRWWHHSAQWCDGCEGWA